MSGYLSWTSRFVIDKPTIAGYQILDPVSELSVARERSGIELRTLAGSSIFQSIRQSTRSPLRVAPLVFELTVSSCGEEDAYRFKRAVQQAELTPVPFFPEYPIEDVWRLDGTTDVFWTLSRQTAFGDFPIATYEPRAFIQDTTDGSTVELTRSATSPPAAGEFYLDPASNDITLETEDLSADVGKLLVLRYHPLFGVSFDSYQESIADVNDMIVSAVLREHVPARAYA